MRKSSTCFSSKESTSIRRFRHTAPTSFVERLPACVELHLRASHAAKVYDSKDTEVEFDSVEQAKSSLQGWCVRLVAEEEGLEAVTTPERSKKWMVAPRTFYCPI